jgi:hypothetical protein
MVVVLILAQFVHMAAVMVALLKVVAIAERAVAVLVTVRLQGRQVKAFTQDQVISVLTDKGMTAAAVVQVPIQQVPQVVVVVVAALAEPGPLLVLVDRAE